MSPTFIVLTSAAVFLIGWDIYAVLKWGKEETISAQIYEGSKQYPILAFALGVLCGHLFWSQG